MYKCNVFNDNYDTDHYEQGYDFLKAFEDIVIRTLLSIQIYTNIRK